MAACTGASRARLWAVVAVLVTVAGIVWIERTNRPLPVEQRNKTAARSYNDAAENAGRRKAGDEAASLPSRSASQEERIERLLEFVEHSDVVFIRNDCEYSGAEAAAHLRDKLRASGLKDPTLDGFIENIATRSSVTGQPYRVRLAGGTTVDAGPWLRLQCEKTSVDTNETSSRESQ